MLVQNYIVLCVSPSAVIYKKVCLTISERCIEMLKISMSYVEMLVAQED